MNYKEIINMYMLKTQCQICKRKYTVPIVSKKEDLRDPILVRRFMRCEKCKSSIEYEYWMEERDYKRRNNKEI